MRPSTGRGLIVSVGVCLLLASGAYGQRQMEKLGRGVVAVRTGTSTVYVGWRMLGTDPSDIGFNLYRSADGGGTVQLTTNQTQTTDFVDSGANLSVTNAYFVRPVTNSVEWTASASFSLPANATVRQYLPLPLHAVTGGAYPPYDVKFCWVGDLDGDGEYDYVVDRLSTVTNANQYVQAYKADGTFLWQMDMGPNSVDQYNIEPGSSAISIGHGDKVTVYDMDGDGRAEVLVCTANGVVLGNGSTITAGNNTTQFISVLNGLTGAELARATVPNPYFSDGPFNGHFGIMYCDGVRPSLVFEGSNRIGSGAFNLTITTWDYRNGSLTQRWTWNRGSQNADDFHQIRIADVDHDGKDEFCEGSYVIDDDGQMLFTTELVHGDRFHITDMDPERPGLETFAIQQDNPTMLGMALYESGTGKMIKKWYQSGVGDVGRGIALDLDPRYKGVEMYSTMGGIYDCTGDKISSFSPWPPEALWWDGDLTREFIDGAGSGALTPVVNKYNYTTGNADRIYTIYSEGVHQAYGGRSAFWGDILGDWREELVLVANDYSEIRIYTTKTAATSRLYTLMHNPAYRMQATCKGYYQANYVDYYLGVEMQPSVPPPVSDARLIWRGDSGTNLWDAGTTVNWSTNWFWSTNQEVSAFSPGDTVLFDMSGSNSVPVSLVGALAPGAVTVYSPNDYVLSGSGSLTGTMTLTKAGQGNLTLATTNDFTGSTLVAEGALIVNGTLDQSPVTVRGGVWLDGAIGGTGFLGNGVTIQSGGSVSPGNGPGAPGTLTISNGLAEADSVVNRFDLSSDPAGTNDLINVLGDLTFTGTNTISINPLNGTLSPGTYTLITYSGAFNGNLSNLIVAGVPGVPVELTNPTGQIVLVVKSARPPTTVTWVGGLSGNAWDLVATSNWWNGATSDQFFPQDTVQFGDTGSTSPAVNLIGTLNPAGVVVNSTNNYTFGGSGVIIGSGGLTKNGSGTLTMNSTGNSYTGPTVIGGGLLAISEIGIAGQPGSLGAAGSSPTNLVLAGGGLRILTDVSYTDRGLTLNPGSNTLEVATSGGLLTILGQVVGGGALVKGGAGRLMFNSNNTYTGGTIIKGGSVQLGTPSANTAGLGTGSVTLTNGVTLNLMGAGADDMGTGGAGGPFANSLIVPAGGSGTLNTPFRFTVSSSLSGGGTLNVGATGVRCDYSGDWSAFSGQVNVSSLSGTSDFRCANSAGYPNARVNLASMVTLQNRAGSGATIPIGELSGAAGSFLPAPGGNGGQSVTWRVGGLNTSATFAGLIQNSVSLIKEGAGTWTLSGQNTYSGSTTVNEGTLLINGNQSGANGAVTVNSGATLGGSGTLSGSTTISSGGTLSPAGSSLGTLTISNNLVVNTGAILQYSLGTSSDRTAVSGNLTVGGTLNVSGGSGFGATTYTLITYGGALTYNGLSMGTKPGGYLYTFDTGTAGQIRLVVAVNTNVPPAPASLSAVASNAAVYLAWSASSGADSYNVKRSTASGGPYTTIASNVVVTSYGDTGLINGTTYYYVVTAVNDVGESPNSPQASATPTAAVPGAPTGLMASPGNTQVMLNWTTTPLAASYNVKRATTSGGPYATIASNVVVTTSTDTGLINGTVYYYVVSGVNANGEGPDSTEVGAMPMLQVGAYWTNTVTSAAQPWNVNGNWTNTASFPNGVGVSAIINADIAANQSNSLNQAITIGSLSIGDLDGSASYSIVANGGSLIFNNGASVPTLTQLATSRGDTIAAPMALTGTLNITNASANSLVLTGVVSGSGVGLVFNGGRVTLLTSNTFNGGAIVRASTVLLGGDLANNGGFGTGSITFNGGTVQMNGYSGSTTPYYGAMPNDLYVPAGQTGVLLCPSRFAGSGITGKLTGAGTFTVATPYVRGFMAGDWSGFTGSMIVTGSDFRINNTKGYAGSSIRLTAGVNFGCMYNSVQTIDIGELSGDAGSQLGTCSQVAGTQAWRIGGKNTSSTFGGNIVNGANAASIFKVGSGTWTLTGTNINVYTGVTTISNGTVQVGNGGTSGVLGTGNVVNWGTLVFNRANAITNSTIISGTGTVYKLGAGTLFFSGTNSYSGGTIISNGTLLVNNTLGNGTGTGAVNAVGGTLGGSGFIRGPVTIAIGGSLAPGNGVGTLTISNNLVVNNAAVLQYELGTSSDRTAISGNLTLGGTLNISDGGGFGTNTYTLFTYPVASNFVYNAVSIGTVPTGYACSISTTTVGQVRLVVTYQPVAAAFSASPTNGLAPLAVTFTDASSGLITNRFWNFGDGNTTNTSAASIGHTYAAGIYTVRLIAGGPAGVSTNTQPNLIAALTPFQSWQILNFGCTTCPEAAAEADPDGDGLSNLAEFLAGTSPTNSLSGLRIISTDLQDNDVLITWATAGGRTNALQATAGGAEGDYDTNFTDISGPIMIPGSGDATTNYLDVGGVTNSPTRYYRIRLVP